MDPEFFDLRYYLGLLIKYLWLVLLIPVLGGTFGCLYSIRQTPIYEAKIIVLVQQRRAELSPGFTDFALSGQVATTYQRQVAALPFLQRVVASMEEGSISVDRLGRMISAHTSNLPPSLDLRVRDRNPAFAKQIADILAEEFRNYAVELRLAEIARLQTLAIAQGLTVGSEFLPAQLAAIDALSILEPASLPTRPIVPKTRRNVLLGVVLGVVVGFGGVLLLGAMKDSVGGPDDLTRRFGLTTLGGVFKWDARDASMRDVVVTGADQSGYAESFKEVRANLQFATANRGGGVYLITSPGPGEGKTTIITNLALAFALAGKRTIVIDGDLRHPGVHRNFEEIDRDPGLSNYLAAEMRDPEQALRATKMEGISVVPGGPAPPNPSELLDSPRMSTLIQRMRELADIVLIDSPPIMLFSDGAILAAQSDGSILAVEGGATRSSSLHAAVNSLSKTQVPIIGVIINKIKKGPLGYNYPYYNYAYYSYYSKYYDRSDGRSKLVKRATSIYKRPFSWIGRALSRIRPSGQ